MIGFVGVVNLQWLLIFKAEERFVRWHIPMLACGPRKAYRSHGVRDHNIDAKSLLSNRSYYSSSHISHGR